MIKSKVKAQYGEVRIGLKEELIQFSETYQCGTGNSSDSNIICNTLNIKITNTNGIFAGTGGSRKYI